MTHTHKLSGTLKDRKLEKINRDVQAYIYTKYDIGTQTSLQAIYTQSDTPIEVKTQLDLLFTWISTVMKHYYTQKNLIKTTEEDWESITWNFSQFDATDPVVSLATYFS
jgi:hypothetical protein